MTPLEVLNQLRLVEKKYKDVKTDTFQVNISAMAKDAADAIDELINKVIVLEDTLDNIEENKEENP